jgi:hypothetical protein
MFIPSLKQNIAFLPFTVKQYNNIKSNNLLYPRLNLGFVLGFINAIKENNINNVNLTAFDKKIIALQFYINELNEININFENLNITHPVEQTISNEIYKFVLNPPALDTERMFCEFIINDNITNTNDLLLCEIAKHLTALYINNTDISIPNTFLEKINLLSKIPSTSLILCMKYIDNIKFQIKQLYTDIGNNNLKYDASLLIP